MNWSCTHFLCRLILPELDEGDAARSTDTVKMDVPVHSAGSEVDSEATNNNYGSGNVGDDNI